MRFCSPLFCSPLNRSARPALACGRPATLCLRARGCLRRAGPYIPNGVSLFTRAFHRNRARRAFTALPGARQPLAETSHAILALVASLAGPNKMLLAHLTDLQMRIHGSALDVFCSKPVAVPHSHHAPRTVPGLVITPIGLTRTLK